MDKKKIAIQCTICAFSLAFEIFGILSLLYASGIATLQAMSFYANMRLILRYVVVIICMAIGIILFNVFAGTFKGKVKNILSISVCVYSTILTLPLLYVFVGCFFAAGGAQLPMVNEVVVEFQDIFQSRGVQNLIFCLGTLMSIIFLAVPILMCVLTVKDMSIGDLLNKIKAKFNSKKTAEVTETAQATEAETAEKVEVVEVVAADKVDANAMTEQKPVEAETDAIEGKKEVKKKVGKKA